MIEYKYPEEELIALHYADFLSNEKAREILEKGFVDDKVEAIVLKNFYWDMVDEVVIDRDNNFELLKDKDVELWMEYIFNSFNRFLIDSGYSEVLDAE